MQTFNRALDLGLPSYQKGEKRVLFQPPILAWLLVYRSLNKTILDAIFKLIQTSYGQQRTFACCFVVVVNLKFNL